MIIQLEIIEEPALFNALLFFILLCIAYAIAVFLEFKEFTSVLSIHAILMFIFAIINIINISFVFFSIIEFAVLFKINSGVNQNE